MKIYDVSLEISNSTIKWPSDPEIEIKDFISIKNGAPANLLTLKFGSHTATHIDAPYHFFKNGNTVDKLKPELFIGKCFVMEIKGDSIKIEDLKNFDFKKYNRILFKTKNSKLLTKKFFSKNYVYLDYDAAKFLVKKNVKLVGIDYLSIEEFNSQEHKVHRLLLKKNIVIIEGLNLSKVKSGEYYIIALPLKIKDGDGSPCRVILLKNELNF